MTKFFQNAADATVNGLSGGGWAKRQFANSVAQKKAAVAPNSMTVQPEADKNVTGRVPVNAAVTPVNLARPLSPFQTVTINLDAKAVNNGQGSGSSVVHLFDIHEAYRRSKGLPLQTAGGPDVYIKSKQNNMLQVLYNQLCSKSMYFYGAKFSASASPSADHNTVEAQLNQIITVHRTGLTEGKYSEISLQEYINPFQNDNKQLAVELMGENALIDNQTTWEIIVLDGIELSITLWLAIEVR